MIDQDVAVPPGQPLGALRRVIDEGPRLADIGLKAGGAEAFAIPREGALGVLFSRTPAAGRPERTTIQEGRRGLGAFAGPAAVITVVPLRRIGRRRRRIGGVGGGGGGGAIRPDGGGALAASEG